MIEAQDWFYKLRYYVFNGELVKIMEVKDGMLHS